MLTCACDLGRRWVELTPGSCSRSRDCNCSRAGSRAWRGCPARMPSTAMCAGPCHAVGRQVQGTGFRVHVVRALVPLVRTAQPRVFGAPPMLPCNDPMHSPATSCAFWPKCTCMSHSSGLNVSGCICLEVTRFRVQAPCCRARYGRSLQGLLLEIMPQTYGKGGSIAATILLPWGLG